MSGPVFGNNLKITKNVVKWKVSLHEEYINGIDKKSSDLKIIVLKKDNINKQLKYVSLILYITSKLVYQ